MHMKLKTSSPHILQHFIMPTIPNPERQLSKSQAADALCFQSWLPSEHMFMKCNLHRIPPPHKSRVDIIHWCSRCGYGWVHVWEHRLLKFMTAHCCLYFFACCRVQGIWSRQEEVGAAQRMLCCFHRNSRCILCHPDHARCHLGHCSFPMFSTPAPKQKYQLLIPKERLD